MYGVLNMLRSLIIQYKPSHVAVVFDAKKAKHSVMSCMRNINLIAHQCQMICVSRLSLCMKWFKLWVLPLLSITGVEADDVIGTLALKAASDGRNVLISTGDKDMAQLVTPNITLINTMTNVIFRPR